MSESSQSLQEIFQQAVRHHRSGRLAEAESLYRRMLKQQPEQPDALHLLGVLAGQAGNNEASIDLIARAIKKNPASAEYRVNLGNAYLQMGQTESAANSLEAALALDPGLGQARRTLANLQVQLGREEDAVESLRALAEASPSDAACQNDLGAAYGRLGRREEALAQYRLAARLAPEEPLYWQNMANCLGELDAPPKDDQFEEDLLHYLTVEGVDPQDVSRAAVSILNERLALGELPARLDDSNAIGSELAVLDHPLLCRLMARVIIADASMEKVFTAVRRRVLELLVSDADFLPEGAPGTDFLYALATQCFLTEYVYNVTSAEREWLDLVRPRAGELPLGTVIMAAYEPLQGGPEDWDSALGGGEGPLDCLITSQVIEPRRELELRDKLPCLTTLEDATSQAVRELYEENPYPRWSSVRHGA